MLRLPDFGPHLAHQARLFWTNLRGRGMKNNHSYQAGQEAVQTPAAAESSASGFNRTRSKLAFDRLVEMGAKMGMENPCFFATSVRPRLPRSYLAKNILTFPHTIIWI